MDTKFIKLKFDLYCLWEGIPPDYRIYVDGDLITERSFIWSSQDHLEEMLQLELASGLHKITLEQLEPCYAKFKIKNFRILQGPAEIIADQSNTFRVLDNEN